MKIPVFLASTLFLCAVQIQTAHAQTAPETARPFFRDVPPTHWAFAAVQKLAAAGVIEGYPPSADTLASPIPNETKIAEEKEELADAVTITPRVKTALNANAALFREAINVDYVVASDTVFLRGYVQNAARKALATAIAKKHAPGSKIVNQLKIAR